MKTKLIAILVILLLIWWLVVYWNLNKKPINDEKIDTIVSEKNSDIETLEKNTEAINQDMVDWNALDNAVSSADITKCDNIIDKKLKLHCQDLVYITKAKFDNDKSICNSIQDIPLKKECIDSFIISNAMKSGKKEDCEKIIWNEEVKKQCLRTSILSEVSMVWFTGSADICNTLEWQDKTNCVSQINKWAAMNILETAVAKKDINACNSIADSKLKASCIESINLEIWMSSTTTSSCNNITDPKNKEYCISSVRKNQDAETFKNSSNSTDTNSCSSINDINTKNQCIEWIANKVAISTLNVAECQKITDSVNKQKCINTVNLLISVKK